MTADPAEEARPRTAIRLRKMLDGDIVAPRWPAGFVMRTMRDEDARAVHELFATVFDDGTDGPFEEWWPRISGDAEFDPELVFLVHDASGRLVGVALAWKRAFLKDLSVHPDARRLGIGEALLTHVFSVFAARGAAHLDLKTEPADSPDALRLYQRHGMVEVDWEG